MRKSKEVLLTIYLGMVIISALHGITNINELDHWWYYFPILLISAIVYAFLLVIPLGIITIYNLVVEKKKSVKATK